MLIARTKLKLLAISVALSAIAAVAVVYSRFKGPQEGQIMALPKSVANAILASTRVRHTATHNGKVQWELEADSAQMQDETKKVVLQSPDVIFFSNDGEQFKLEANQGILDTKNNNMVVEGGVHLYSHRYTVYTEKMTYQHAKRLLVSKGRINILNDAVQLQANAMTYDIENNQVQFNGQVEGNIVSETGM